MRKRWRRPSYDGAPRSDAAVRLEPAAAHAQATAAVPAENPTPNPIDNTCNGFPEFLILVAKVKESPHVSNRSKTENAHSS